MQVLFIVVGVVLVALALVPGLTLWRVFAAWQYRNPEQNEPSGAAMAVTRVSMVLMAVMAFVAAAQLPSSGGERVHDAGERPSEPDGPAAALREAVEGTVFILENQPSSTVDGDHSRLIGAHLRSLAGDGATPAVRTVRGGTYEITAEETDAAHCLTVWYAGDSDRLTTRWTPQACG